MFNNPDLPIHGNAVRFGKAPAGAYFFSAFLMKVIDWNDIRPWVVRQANIGLRRNIEILY
jgi:hypothetical protein